MDDLGVSGRAAWVPAGHVPTAIGCLPDCRLGTPAAARGAGGHEGTQVHGPKIGPEEPVAQDVHLPPGDDHPKRLRATVHDDNADAGAPLGAGGLGKAGLGRPGGGTDLGIVRQISTGGNPDELDRPPQYRRLPRSRPHACT
jgi:hypothetical protein